MPPPLPTSGLTLTGVLTDWNFTQTIFGGHVKNNCFSTFCTKINNLELNQTTNYDCCGHAQTIS